jgi:hypothetical protein
LRVQESASWDATRCTQYGDYKGVSETVPPGGGGALAAATPLRTLPRAFVLTPQTFRWGKASPEI